jgi:drug/metabolite transporter (DMT)-like permease
VTITSSVLSRYPGELAALSAAMIWALSSVVYGQIGRIVSPLLLNLVKGVIAIALLILTLLLTGQLFPTVSQTALGLMLLSGLIGIGVGDTAYFVALNHLGARRALVLESLAPPLAALLAWVFLQERLPWSAWFGIGLTVGGVLWVVLEQTSPPLKTETMPPQPANGSRFYGAMAGVLAAVGQAVGVVLSRGALAGTEINPLWSTLIRLLAGVAGLLLWLGWQRLGVQRIGLGMRSPQEVLQESPSVWAELKPLGASLRLAGTLIAAAFGSTFLGIWLQQIALKYASAGVAQSLSATSPLFVIPIVMLLGERVSRRAIAGALIAIAGIRLLFA